MNAAQAGVENLDLEKLNDKDKAELRQFLANEQQRSQIQSPCDHLESGDSGR
ncbi:CorA family metal ion transporter, partial [Metarhizium majus ARSEF 297]